MLRLAAKYGRKSGLLRHCTALALMHTGLLRRYVQPAPGLAAGQVVFVCKGNIARSAYAEARARAMGLQNVASAGLRTESGKPANPDAIRAAAVRGTDLSQHRARRIDELQLGPDDHVFAFEVGQVRALVQTCPARVLLLGGWARPARPHIEDPYGRTDEYYAECFGVIDSALQGLLAEQDEGLLASSGR